MEESEDNISSEDINSTNSPLPAKKKSKKRSLIERELETNLTLRVTSPITNGDGINTSRYGRARRYKSHAEQSSTKKDISEMKSPVLEKSPLPEKSPTKVQNQSPVYKMHASNSPLKIAKTPKAEKFIDNQIETIYQENMSLSRFSNEDENSLTPSPGKKFPKLYVRKDLIQKREPEDTVMVIQNMFSPVKSGKKSSSTHLNNILERSCEKYSLNSKQPNGLVGNSSVVKTLDFDAKKKKDTNVSLSKSELFDLEAKCTYQVGDLAWARMGTYPFWPSIITREPSSGLFVKRKLFGRIERDILHVTFFGDNGRRSWIVDNMLQKYLGLEEFEATRDNFTPQEKKKDPRLYAAYFVSEKKRALWNVSVEEAEMLLKEPKRLRIDIFNDMLVKSRSGKAKQPKSKISRTDSDVSLSESLYDSLFSEDDGKSDNNDKSRNRLRNKSLDMFEVVTACLDNMAAKSGITKIQRQSHMDRWLQKAKSKTPEKTKAQLQVVINKLEEKNEIKFYNAKEKKTPLKTVVNKGYSLRRKTDAQNLPINENEHDNVANRQDHDLEIGVDNDSKQVSLKEANGLGIICKVESLAGNNKHETENVANITDESETFTDASADSNSINFGKNNMRDDTIPKVETSNNFDPNGLIQNSLELENESEDLSSTNIEISRHVKHSESLDNANLSTSRISKDNENLISLKNPCNNQNLNHQNNQNMLTLMTSNNDTTSESLGSRNLSEASNENDSEKNTNIWDSSESQASSNQNSQIITNQKKAREDLSSASIYTKDWSKSSENNGSDSSDFCHSRENQNKQSNRTLQKSREDKVSEDGNSIDLCKTNEKQSANRTGFCKSNDSQDSNNKNILSNTISPKTTEDQTCKGMNTMDLEKTSNEKVNENDTEFQNLNKSQHSTDLNKSEENQSSHSAHNTDLSEICDGKVSESSICLHSSKREQYNNIQFQVSENIISALPDRGENSVNINLTKMEIQNIIIDNNTIKSACTPWDVSNAMENKDVVSSTPKCKQNNLGLIQRDDVNIEEVNDDDNMSVDEDSDSERLPYSPLSNLGNNSDENLSIHDLPFDGHISDSETGNISANKTLYGNTKITDNGDLQLKNQIEIETVRDTSIVIAHNLKEQNGENIHTNNLNNHYTEYGGNDISNINVSHENEEDDEVVNKEDKITSKNIDSILIPNEEHKQEILEKQEKVVVTTKNKGGENNKDSTSNGYRGQNVRALDMASKEVQTYISDSVPEPIQVNDFYDKSGERVSINLEHNTDLSKFDEKRKLLFKQDDKQADSFHNSEFLKYMEIRKDAILDENPEISEKELVAYLYKTWLYEENGKSDVKKNEELRECNLVKGQTQAQVDPPPRKKNLSIKKKQAKNNTGNLKMFLRRIKDNETDLQGKRTVHKNIEEYDDNDLPIKNKWHILLGPGEKSTALAVSDSRKSKEIKDIHKLCNGVNEVSKVCEIYEIVDDNNYGLESTHFVTQSNNNSTPTIENKMIIKESSDVSSESVIESNNKLLLKDDLGKHSRDAEDIETPLIKCKLSAQENNDFPGEIKDDKVIKEESDIIAVRSDESEVSANKRKKKLGSKKVEKSLEDPEFVKYLELRQDSLIEEHPELTRDEILAYLYQTWLYEENTKSELKKTDEIEQSIMVKGLNDTVQQPKKVKRKIPKTEKTDKHIEDDSPNKPKRKSVKPFYNEEYSDIEEELEVYEIFKPRKNAFIKIEAESTTLSEPLLNEAEVYDEVELYFAELTKPKPNIFKGLLREKVCEICERFGNLVKCKGCSNMFHIDCVKKQTEVVEIPNSTPKGRKKKRKLTQRFKNSEELDNEQNISEENNASTEEIFETEPITVDAEVLEAQLSAKIKEILGSEENIEYDSYSSDECQDWNESLPGKCEIVEVKLKPRQSLQETDCTDFKCNDCQKYNIPVCFVCKRAVSNKDSTNRQNCHVAHCHKYYHLECLDHWPQTQFSGGDSSKKSNEHFESFTCPRHVCHTCVSDDPRGCKTRFSGDKLARCLRCPATYHSFTKCLPAGSQILTASHIICPRHHEHRAGKAPCHVNTGWCFICALGGSLICCEYCPTSFHAECLNIDPPEGGYMCEDCETGRLPLYGEMVWVKLGHYRWWPGIILHPYEIPENLLAVKHSPGEFVVRFFGQYDHYWVNRGRVFPFQEGDSGRISSQKSKIDAAFTMAVEHAQRACQILKTAQPNEEESMDIASSLLPPHYVKLKVNKPRGTLCGRRPEDPESSLTQCECNPLDEDPCGLYSQCLNRMLLTECGPICRAGDRCNNRAFEKRLYPKLVPYRTPSRGWGLKTLEDIKAGQFVIEYVGELIDEEEFKRRMRRKHEMRDENFYFLTLDKERMIDAGPKGNLARFMNHCCEPNCETQKWTVLGDVRVGLFALYDIPAQSEVTFNYNLECAGIDKKRCMCGAKRCSGYIGAKPKQEESQPKKNKLTGKRVYKKRKPEESPSTKSIKRPLGRPRKPKELTEIEKDLLIIKNATNGLSSDESTRSHSTEPDKHPKSLKRKRISDEGENVQSRTESPNVKKTKLDVKAGV